MKIVLEDLNGKSLRIIRKTEDQEFFKYTPKVMDIEYNENHAIFDSLNHDIIVLRPCENSEDFLIEYISLEGISTTHFPISSKKG